MKILALAGPNGSGKTMLVRELVHRYRHKVIESDDAQTRRGTVISRPWTIFSMDGVKMVVLGDYDTNKTIFLGTDQITRGEVWKSLYSAPKVDILLLEGQRFGYGYGYLRLRACSRMFHDTEPFVIWVRCSVKETKERALKRPTKWKHGDVERQYENMATGFMQVLKGHGLVLENPIGKSPKTLVDELSSCILKILKD